MTSNRSPFQRLGIWLCEQWRVSLARSIWADLTPLGRVFFFGPTWFLTMLAIPLLMLAFSVAVVINAIFARPLQWFWRLFWVAE